MDGDWPEVSSVAEDGCPHLMSPDPFSTAPLTPTNAPTHHRRMNSVGSYGSPFQSVVNRGSHFFGVQEIDRLFQDSPRRDPVAPTVVVNQSSPGHSSLGMDLSGIKPSRYSFGVLGDELRPQFNQKSNMVRKMFGHTQPVHPLERCKSESKPKRRLHRRDSFASLPKISDLGISTEDLVDIGTPEKLFKGVGASQFFYR